jgi:hypothetical protein
MYTLLRSLLPKPLCDWLVALCFAFLIILVFVLWDSDMTGFHYLDI